MSVELRARAQGWSLGFHARPRLDEHFDYEGFQNTRTLNPKPLNPKPMGAVAKDCPSVLKRIPKALVGNS